MLFDVMIVTLEGRKNVIRTSCPSRILIIFNFTFAVDRGIRLPGMDAAYILALVTILICGAGRIWGVDQFLRTKWNINVFT